MESLIEASDLPLADKRWLHGIRRVRNVLIHNADVYVGKSYARIAELIQKLQDPKIQMLAVVAEGRLCGIVTRADVIRFTL